MLAGEECIVERKSEEPFSYDEDRYRIINDRHPFGFDMREGNLELIEITESEKSKSLFEKVMDGSYYNDAIYMEGVRNHMIEAGIDPTTNNPKDYIYFQEMAGRLPRDKTGNFNLVIAVGSREKEIPHFHVFRSEEDFEAWNNGACLFFTKNKYYDHAKNAETLTRKELSDVINVLKQSYRKNKSVTNWQQLVNLWNDSNDRYEIPDDTPMPNYDYKTITRYKENSK